jgi:hypothetical protein
MPVMIFVFLESFFQKLAMHAMGLGRGFFAGVSASGGSSVMVGTTGVSGSDWGATSSIWTGLPQLGQDSAPSGRDLPQMAQGALSRGAESTGALGRKSVPRGFWGMGIPHLGQASTFSGRGLPQMGQLFSIVNLPFRLG